MKKVILLGALSVLVCSASGNAAKRPENAKKEMQSSFAAAAPGSPGSPAAPAPAQARKKEMEAGALARLAEEDPKIAAALRPLTERAALADKVGATVDDKRLAALAARLLRLAEKDAEKDELDAEEAYAAGEGYGRSAAEREKQAIKQMRVQMSDAFDKFVDMLREGASDEQVEAANQRYLCLQTRMDDAKEAARKKRIAAAERAETERDAATPEAAPAAPKAAEAPKTAAEAASEQDVDPSTLPFAQRRQMFQQKHDD